MKTVLIINLLIEIAWVIASVTMVLTGHNGWAVAFFIGAIFCGYTWKHIKKVAEHEG